jgi:hypothetical protein
MAYGNDQEVFSTNIFMELRYDVLQAEYNKTDLKLGKLSNLKFDEKDSKEDQSAVAAFIANLENKKDRIKAAAAAVVPEGDQEEEALNIQKGKTK